jgi:hypothetical protein
VRVISISLKQMHQIQVPIEYVEVEKAAASFKG